MTVTLLITITLTILVTVLLATLTLASMLLAEEANDRRDRRDYAHRLTNGGTLKL